MNKEYRLTKKRLAWLRQLDKGDRSMRARTRVGYDCMQAGWTEWNYVDHDKRELTWREASEAFGTRWWDHVRIKGERLTEAGRMLLAANKEE